MISETAVSDALGKRLTSASLSYPIAWENMQAGLPAAPFLIFEMVPTVTTDATFDGSGQISRGFAQITVVSKLGGSDRTAKGIAQSIANRFSYPTTLTETGVEVTITAPPAIQQGYPDDAHWRIPVQIPYTALKRATT